MVDDVESEYERLRTAGMTFTRPPDAIGSVTTAVLDGGCGHLIQLVVR